jgi:ammonium transporter, Amt family
MLHLDTGNTGFMILCTSLVMLMTPGLAFFYGGLVGRKNVLAIMIQSFVSMGDGESKRDERGNRPR